MIAVAASNDPALNGVVIGLAPYFSSYLALNSSERGALQRR
jgi:hypothetical protein